MRKFAILVALCAGLGCSGAQADIYGYIDDEGSAHFSTEKIDARYQLFLHGNASFDSSQLSPLPDNAATAAAPPPAIKSPLFHFLSQHPNLKKYEPLLNQAALEFSLEPALLKAVMAAESGFNAKAVSPKGAIGLMQVMPATAERYGVQGDLKQSIEQKLADPKINIRLGARYLRDLRKMFPKRQELVIASYNAGEGAIQKYKNNIPPYPETRNYVQLVTQFYQFYRPAIDKDALVAMTAPGTSPDGTPRRIHMTIPGRRNMPQAVPANTYE
jgi:soluble lytic murein transglycosylase-like protein